jgi:hypothetical protein
MKKVKLLGALACASMLLAGCNGGNKESTEPTAEPTSSSAVPSSSSSEPVPTKSEWTDEEVDAIYKIMQWKGEKTKYFEFPCAYGLTLTEVNDESEYLLALGDKVEAKELEAYGELICGDDYGFVAVEAGVVQDIELIEEFVEGSVTVYEKNYFDDGYSHFPSVYGKVAVGQELKTKKIKVCATVSLTANDGAVFEDNRGFDGSHYQTILQYCAQSIFLLNDYPGLEEATTEAEQEAIIAEAMSYLVLPTVAQPDFIGVEDLGYTNPFTYGNCYSQYFHANDMFVIDGATAEEVASYKDDILAAGYTLVEGSDWEYSKTVEGKGTFTLGAHHMHKDEGDEPFSMLQCEIDFVAPKVSA